MTNFQNTGNSEAATPANKIEAKRQRMAAQAEKYQAQARDREQRRVSSGPDMTIMPDTPPETQAEVDFTAQVAQAKAQANANVEAVAGPMTEPSPSARQGKNTGKRRKLVPTPISIIKKRDFPTDCIEGLLPQTGLAVLGGASGDGKSFLALDMGAHIVFQLNWFGRRVERARQVFYFYLENPDGIKQRVLAWEKQNPDHQITDGCGYEFFEVSLDMATDVEELAEILPKDAVVIIDTMRKANPGENENTPEGMGRILARMQKLTTLRRDVLVVVVHHVPKTSTQAADSRNKLAGHYSLPADTDAVLLTERKGDERTLWVGKAREDEDGLGFSYELKKHEVGKRPNNTTVTSLAVEWTGQPTKAKVARKMSDPERWARQALSEIQDFSRGEPIQYADWRDRFFAHAKDERPETEPKTVQKQFERGRDKLVSLGVAKIIGGRIVRILNSLD